MAFITNGSEYNGAESLEIIVRPHANRLKVDGIRTIITERAGSVKMTYFSKSPKLLVKYSDGWQGGNGATKKQKKFELGEFKAEASYSKQDYVGTILEVATDGGSIAQNEITGTQVHNAEIEVFARGIDHDTSRIFWLGDTDKKHRAAGTYPDGTAYAIGDEDKYYSNIDGVWTHIMNDAVVYTSATDDDVRRIEMSNAAVARVDTATLTGTSGTANVTVNGVAYLATFDTDLTTTAANFVTTHAAALLLRGIVVTSSTADVILTSSIAGVDFIGTTAVANVSGNLAGSVAATTPNTAAAALGTDEAVDTFKAMYRNASQELKGMPKGDLILYVTDSMLENYEDTLENAGTENARTQTIDGMERMFWNRIQIAPMPIDSILDADFGGAYPHRAILAEKNTLAMVYSTAGDFAETKFWFENKDNLNMQRTQFEFGANYTIPEALIVAY